MSRRDWEQERRARILGKSRISVTASGLKITLEGKTRAIASFRQHYVADHINVSSFKLLHLTLEKGRWVILREATGN
jgi:hypothetical protein